MNVKRNFLNITDNFKIKFLEIKRYLIIKWEEKKISLLKKQ